MPPLAFEPTILAGERPQTYAVDRAATKTGNSVPYSQEICTLKRHLLQQSVTWCSL